jgi:SpoVK/Ycf46/Vps4 family AAA+-type ATPase
MDFMNIENRDNRQKPTKIVLNTELEKEFDLQTLAQKFTSIINNQTEEISAQRLVLQDFIRQPRIKQAWLGGEKKIALQNFVKLAFYESLYWVLPVYGYNVLLKSPEFWNVSRQYTALKIMDLRIQSRTQLQRLPINVLGSVGLIPALIGLTYFLQNRYPKHTLHVLFSKTLPGLANPAEEKMSWETFEYMTHSDLDPVEVQWYERFLLLRRQKQHGLYAHEVLDTRSSKPNIILYSKLLESSPVNDFYRSLDELPSSLESFFDSAHRTQNPADGLSPKINDHKANLQFHSNIYISKKNKLPLTKTKIQYSTQSVSALFSKETPIEALPNDLIGVYSTRNTSINSVPSLELENSLLDQNETLRHRRVLLEFTENLIQNDLILKDFITNGLNNYSDHITNIELEKVTQQWGLDSTQVVRLNQLLKKLQITGVTYPEFVQLWRVQPELRDELVANELQSSATHTVPTVNKYPLTLKTGRKKGWKPWTLWTAKTTQSTPFRFIKKPTSLLEQAIAAIPREDLDERDNYEQSTLYRRINSEFEKIRSIRDKKTFLEVFSSQFKAVSKDSQSGVKKVKKTDKTKKQESQDPVANANLLHQKRLQQTYYQILSFVDDLQSDFQTSKNEQTRETVLKRLVQWSENFIDIDDNVVPVRQMSGYRYPDMTAHEIFRFLFQQAFSFSSNTTLNFLRIQLPSSFLQTRARETAVKNFLPINPRGFKLQTKNVVLKNYQGPVVIFDPQKGFDWNDSLSRGIETDALTNSEYKPAESLFSRLFQLFSPYNPLATTAQLNTYDLENVDFYETGVIKSNERSSYRNIFEWVRDLPVFREKEPYIFHIPNPLADTPPDIENEENTEIPKTATQAKPNKKNKKVNNQQTDKKGSETKEPLQPLKWKRENSRTTLLFPHFDRAESFVAAMNENHVADEWVYSFSNYFPERPEVERNQGVIIPFKTTIIVPDFPSIEADLGANQSQHDSVFTTLSQPLQTMLLTSNTEGQHQIASTNITQVPLVVAQVPTGKNIEFIFELSPLIDYEFKGPILLKPFQFVERMFSPATVSSDSIEEPLNATPMIYRRQFDMFPTSTWKDLGNSLLRGSGKDFLNGVTNTSITPKYDFEEVWEPLQQSSNFWLLVSRIGIIYSLFQLFKLVNAAYIQELIAYTIIALDRADFLSYELRDTLQILLKRGQQSGYRIIPESHKKWDQLVGIEKLLPQISELVTELRKAHYPFSKALPIAPGVLFAGPPGTGKTILAQAMATEAHVSMIIITGSSLVEAAKSGTSAEKLELAFAEARKNAPCILFIDEMDSFAERRSEIDSGAKYGEELIDVLDNPDWWRRRISSYDPVITDRIKKQIRKERLRTLLQLLIEMDGITSDSGVIVIGASNHPEVLDPALLRPGRFNQTLHFSLPDENQRLSILKQYGESRGFETTIPWKYLVDRTEGYSPADLASIMYQSALQSIISNTRHTMETIEFGIERITTYEVFKPKDASKLNIGKLRLAYHQIGKVILGLLLQHSPKVVVAYLWPRKLNTRALRIASILYENFLKGAQPKDLQERLIGCYAGKAAELLFLEHAADQDGFVYQSTLGIEDFHFAQELVDLMVKKWSWYSNISNIFPYFQFREDRNRKLFFELEMPEMLEIYQQKSQTVFIDPPLEKTVAGPMWRPPTKESAADPFSRNAQTYYQIPWLQTEVTQNFQYATRYFSEWFRVYLPDPGTLKIFNPQWVNPDVYYHNNVPAESQNSEQWNKMDQATHDYLIQSLILNGFNAAIAQLDNHRELLDHLVFELSQKEVLRSFEIEEILAQFGYPIPINSQLEPSTISFQIPSLDGSLVISKSWGESSHRSLGKWIPPQ